MWTENKNFQHFMHNKVMKECLKFPFIPLRFIRWHFSTRTVLTLYFIVVRCSTMCAVKREKGKPKLLSASEGKRIHSVIIIIIIIHNCEREEKIFRFIFWFILLFIQVFLFPTNLHISYVCYYQMFMHAKYYIMHKWNIEDWALTVLFAFLPLSLLFSFF